MTYFTKLEQILKKKLALAGVAQWIDCGPAKQGVTDSIPSQDTCLGSKRQAHIDVSLPLFFPPFPSKNK